MISPAPILIIGRGGHARVIAAAAAAAALKTVCATSDDPKLAEMLETLGISEFIVGIGDNADRERVTQEMIDRFPRIGPCYLAHPTSFIDEGVAIGPGAIIMAGAIVQTGAALGAGCLVNTGATVDHDCELGPFSSVGPQCAMGGRVTLGERAAVCIGAVVKDRITIGADTVVGAGAVVVRDVPPCVVAYGSPCKPIRTRARGGRYL